ncbi:MAG TPA: sulfatase [Pseudomonadales bacterium]|nr:sulfatase [Pseudomonadales bacterium]
MSNKKIVYWLLAIVAIGGLIVVLTRFYKPSLATSLLSTEKSAPTTPEVLPLIPAKRPNFLFVVTDDQSWIHTSFAGYAAVKTPNFDRIASEGIYFDNAYASAPTCTASRSAIVTGQHFWRLGSAAQLWGEFPETLNTYQKILAANGYKIGYTGKGWGPGKAAKGNPAGPAFNQITKAVDPNLSSYDHLENFRSFLKEKKPDEPFSFWVSPTEPHRPYLHDIGVSSGEIDASKIEVPAFMPDVPEVRNDIADYLYEIQWFDKELGEILKLLTETGELDNTVIVYTSDNGMPFPRAKANNYEYGTRVPFAVRWGNTIKKHQDVTDFISLTDIAPTFLDLAGITPPADMTGKSFRTQLLSEKSGRIDKSRDAAFSGFERHIKDARFNNRGYPSRAIHTDKFLYIQNMAPDRWPAGRSPGMLDIDDGSPSKDLLQQREKYAEFIELSAGRRPPVELYALDRDPAQLHNIADDPEYQAIKASLMERLFEEMKKTGDPWTTGNGEIFDTYTYYAKDYL